MLALKKHFLGQVGLVLLLILTSCGGAAQENPPDSTLADNLQVITPSNVHNLEPVATLGKGRLLNIGTLDDDQILAALSSNGIWLYNADDLSAVPTHVAFDVNPFIENTPGPKTDSRPPLPAAFEGTAIRFIWQDQLWTIDVKSGEQRAEPAPEDANIGASEGTISPDGLWELTMERDPETFRRIQTLSNTEIDTAHDLSDAGCGGLSKQPSFAFSKDSTRLFAATNGDDSTITAWDVETGAFLGMTGGYEPSIYDVAISGDGRWLAAVGGVGNARVAAFCPESRHPGSGIYLTDLKAGTTTLVTTPDMLTPYHVALSDDGSTLAVIASGEFAPDDFGNIYDTLFLWKAGEFVGYADVYKPPPPEEQAAGNPGSNPGNFLDIALSSDGKYLALFGIRAVHVWDLEAFRAGEQQYTVLDIRYTSHDVNPAAWDVLTTYWGNHFLTFNDHILLYMDVNKIHLWDADQQQEIGVLETNVIVSEIILDTNRQLLYVQPPDIGDELVLLGEDSAQLSEELVNELKERYGLEDVGTLVWQLGSTPEIINELPLIQANQTAINPNGTLLVAYTRDNRAAFILTETGLPIFNIDASLRPLPTVFSPDGTFIPLVSLKDGLQLWGVPGK